MRSSFAGLEMSKRTIQISQKALDISTGNMANVTTEGYTRQRVDTHSMYLRSYKNWQTKQSRLSLAAQGVNAFGVAQIRDQYLDKRFREMNSYLAEFEVKQPIYEEMQTTIDLYENIGMEKMLANFKAALTTYATDAPDNKELATLFRNSAFDITKMLNTYARDFNKLLEDNVFEIGAVIGHVNTIIDKVFALNEAIVKEYKATEYGNIASGKGVSGYGPLELMDARNLLIDELSSYINLRVDENADGSVNLFLGDVLMVDGIKNSEHVVMRDFDNFHAAVIEASNGLSLNIRAGEIKGYMELVNGNGPYANSYQSSAYGIPYYINAMDAFAESLAELFNSTNGVTGTSAEESYRAMFASTLDVYDDDGRLIERGPITAATIRISDEWMENANMVGYVFDEVIGKFAESFSFDSTSIVPGNPYYLDITLEDVTHRVTFDGTAADLQDQIDALFPPNTNTTPPTSVINVTTEGGIITIKPSHPDVKIDVVPFGPEVTAGIGAAAGTFKFSPDNLTIPGTYSVNVEVNGVAETINFYYDGTLTDLQASINAAFASPNGVNVSFDADGNIVFEPEDPNDTLSVRNSMILTETSRNITTGTWAYAANLDANHAHTLLLALDKPVKYGRSLDFDGTPFDYVAFLSNRLGQGIEFIDTERKNMTVTTTNLLDSRDAVAGVSTDEEGINMLIYQKWYNAAARMMTAMDEALDRVINHMGRVGL